MASTLVKLIEHPLSSYAQKVKIALREKGIPFKAEVPDGLASARRDTPLSKANPRMEIPILVDGDTTVFDSTVILEYLEDRWPDRRPLLPPASDPAARAKARMIEDICDTQYEAINWGYGEILWFRRAEGEAAEKMKQEVGQQVKVLQAWLTEKLGDADWFGGADFGWADAAVAPMVNRSVWNGFGPEEGSPLQKWHARIKERPSVRDTFREFDAVVPMMFDAAKLYLSGERKREYRDHRLEWMVRSGGLDIVAKGIKDGNIKFSWPYSNL